MTSHGATGQVLKDLWIYFNLKAIFLSVMMTVFAFLKEVDISLHELGTAQLKLVLSAEEKVRKLL